VKEDNMGRDAARDSKPKGDVDPQGPGPPVETPPCASRPTSFLFPPFILPSLRNWGWLSLGLHTAERRTLVLF
jgi:hypothetical protein